MQNKEKQIEEMAKHCHFAKKGKCLLLGDEAVDCNAECDICEFAKSLYNAGYRKASDVARETVEAIKNEVSKKEQYVSDLYGYGAYGYGGYVIATTDLEDIIRRYMFDTYDEAELKKKYTEGEST